MLFFQDGPYIGQGVNCRRAPFFLRVVFGDELDALDQLEDEPGPQERITVYIRIEKPATGIACSRGRGGKGCQPFIVANYRLYDRQPNRETMRSREAWQTWCLAEQGRAKLWLLAQPDCDLLAFAQAQQMNMGPLFGDKR